MAKKQRIFSVQELEQYIVNAPNIKEVSSIIIIAMGQVSQKKLSDYAFAGLLAKASEKIYQFN